MTIYKQPGSPYYYYDFYFEKRQGLINRDEAMLVIKDDDAEHFGIKDASDKLTCVARSIGRLSRCSLCPDCNFC
jgi:hypothetical protein